MSIDWRALEAATALHRAELDGGPTISYVDEGKGGPPLLLVHGLGASWQAWLANLPDLTSRRRVLVVDLPGFGRSPRHGTDAGYRWYASVLARLVDHLGCGPVVPVGNSFGGWVSAELVRSRPDIVAGLGLVDAVGIPPNRAERLRLNAVMGLVRLTGDAVARRREAAVSTARRRKLVLGPIVAHPDRMPADLAVQLIPAEPATMFDLVLKQGRKAFDDRWRQDLAKVDVPCAVIWGERDKLVPLRHAYLYAELFPDAVVSVVPDAGHVPMIERPDRVDLAICDLLRRVDAAPLQTP